jgi:hypothetical protein
MTVSPIALALAVIGLVGGIFLFGRGLVAYRRDRLITAVATSSLDGLAAGEVRVTGVVQALDQQLTSPLQSRPCVWYRARIETTGDNSRVLFAEERAVHFRVTDEHGQVRVVPRGARWEIGLAFDASTGLMGNEPAGLVRRRGAGYSPILPDDPERLTGSQRQAAIEALLTVAPTPPEDPEAADGTRSGLLGVALNGPGRHYEEARLEVGQNVTVLGHAMPWGDLRHEQLEAAIDSNVERAIADDIAAARATGELAASPEEAWGNAAIPGFGIGRPTRAPELDPEADAPDVAGPAADRAAMARYELPAEELVVAGSSDGGLAIYAGTPAAAVQRHDLAFVLGLVGAVMAVVGALALGAAVTGTL